MFGDDDKEDAWEFPGVIGTSDEFKDSSGLTGVHQSVWSRVLSSRDADYCLRILHRHITDIVQRSGILDSRRDRSVHYFSGVMSTFIASTISFICVEVTE